MKLFGRLTTEPTGVISVLGCTGFDSSAAGEDISMITSTADLNALEAFTEISTHAEQPVAKLQDSVQGSTGPLSGVNETSEGYPNSLLVQTIQGRNFERFTSLMAALFTTVFNSVLSTWRRITPGILTSNP